MKTEKRFGQLSTFTNADLHIHTIESQYKDKKIVNESDTAHIDVILSKLNENNINLFSFADHNRFNTEIYDKAIEIITSDKGKRAYPNVKNIVPSVEFDVVIDEGNPDCHILTIFDAKTKNERETIKNVIDKDKLLSPKESYSLERYVKILKKIGLPTILIACQRKALNNKDSDNDNSLSDSCNDVVEFLKTGFISALEYQKPNVEGILINSLSDFEESVKPSLVANSDCHEWSAYPNHDSKNKQKSKSWYFEIKSQPTFLGLLLAITSPQTRFKRKNANNQHIHFFMFNGEKHELSPGFNAIIGENGSGKSTLLSVLSPNAADSSAAYIKSIKNINSIYSPESNNFVQKVKYIKQGDLVRLDNKDGLFSKDISFPTVDNTIFNNSIENYKKSLLKKIENNIKYTNAKLLLKDKLFTFDEQYENASSFFVTVTLRNGFANGENKFKGQLKSINTIIASIKSLISSNEYSKTQKSHLEKALKEMEIVQCEVHHNLKELEFTNSIKNAIVNCVNSYSDRIKQLSSSFDTKLSAYTKDKQSFVDCVVEMVAADIDKNKIITLPNIKKGKGFSYVDKQGFRFMSTALYHEIDDIEESLLDSVFNSSYRKREFLLSIDTESEFRSAISNCGSNGDYKTKLNDNVQKFIALQTNTIKSVLEIGTNNKTGATLGEQSLSYYKFITNSESKESIFLIDQPEDNISVPGIMERLITYLNNLRDKKQIIFVTHNPLLVINMDVDNVIFLKRNENGIECESGCLESEGILEYVENNLDGGKEALRKRLKVYE